MLVNSNVYRCDMRITVHHKKNTATIIDIYRFVYNDWRWKGTRIMCAKWDEFHHNNLLSVHILLLHIQFTYEHDKVILRKRRNFILLWNIYGVDECVLLQIPARWWRFFFRILYCMWYFRFCGLYDKLFGVYLIIAKQAHSFRINQTFRRHGSSDPIDFVKEIINIFGGYLINVGSVNCVLVKTRKCWIVFVDNINTYLNWRNPLCKCKTKWLEVLVFIIEC